MAASGGGDGTVFAVEDEMVDTGGVIDVGTLFDGLVVTVVTAVAVVGADVEVGSGETVDGLVAVVETFWLSAEEQVTVTELDVEDDKAQVCSKSSPTELLAETELAEVVTADVTLSVVDKVLVAVVTGVDVEPVGDAESVDGVVAAGVEAALVWAELGSVVFTVVAPECFGSSEDLEAVETTADGFILGGVDVKVLVDGGEVVVAVIGIVADVETDETWLCTVAGVEQVNCAEAEVDEATLVGGAATRGAGWSLTGVEGWSVALEA